MAVIILETAERGNPSRCAGLRACAFRTDRSLERRLSARVSESIASVFA